MKSPRLIKMLHDLTKAMQYIFKTIEVKFDEDGDGDSAMILVDGWLLVWEGTAWVKTLKTDKHIECWNLGYVTYDPGVRYHKDGSGTPPSWDMHDINTEKPVTSMLDVVAILSEYVVRKRTEDLTEQAHAEMCDNLPEE